MNAMMAAFNKAAKEDPNGIGALVQGAKTVHKEKVYQQRDEAKKKLLAQAEEDRIQAELDAEAEERKLNEIKAENKKKKIFSWVVTPRRYSMECGIIFAYDITEATSMVEAMWKNPINIDVTECDYSKSIVYIGSYME